MRLSEIRTFGVFQIIVLILSVYAFGALIADAFFNLSPEASYLIQIFDYIVCAVFFTDFVIQLWAAERKLDYLKWGWIDLLASIPNVDFLRWARVFRVFRILRVIRAVRGTQKLYQFFRAREALGGSVSLTAFILVLFGSISILMVETAPDSKILTGGDALWWTLTTITTVGYGDLYPVTPAGRVVASILMIGGVGLFGSFTALVASWFTGKTAAIEGSEKDTLLKEIQALRLEIQALRQHQEKQP